MCGIAGIYWLNGRQVSSSDMLLRMGRIMVHRGPDGEGTFVDGSVGMVHRRLSIIDVEGGHQPMRRSEQGATIVYNGELYNYRQLRTELQASGVAFVTHSDTEVVLAAYEMFGEKCLDRLSGMFAFAIFDPTKRSLFLARDRLGIKPLYYLHTREAFVFASELPPLLATGLSEKRPNPKALRALLLNQFIPGEDAFIKGAKRLLPGCCMTVTPERVRNRRYWSLGPAPDRPRSKAEAVSRLKEIFFSSVSGCMLSDVPLGAFLSGGIDSSYVVAALAEMSREPVMTFTVRFRTDDPKYDEADSAKLVADHLGTDHHEVEIDQATMQTAAVKVIASLDEPLIDPALVPTYLLAKVASEHVKVVLTGEGADEVFGGYPRYLKQALARFIPGRDQNYRPTFIFEQAELDDLLSKDQLSQTSSENPTRFLLPYPHPDYINRLTYSEMLTSLPDDLLFKVDKMTMLCSLEARVPYLDHDLVEFGLSLPGSWKVHGWSLKHILKRSAAEKLPRSVIGRKKHGFTLPIASWLRAGRFADDVRSCVRDGTLSRSGLVNPSVLRSWCDRPIQTPRLARCLWALYTLEIWLSSRQRDGFIDVRS